MIGSETFSSTKTKATASATAPISSASVVPLPQPLFGPDQETASSSEVTAPVTIAAPR